MASRHVTRILSRFGLALVLFTALWLLLSVSTGPALLADRDGALGSRPLFAAGDGSAHRSFLPIAALRYDPHAIPKLFCDAPPLMWASDPDGVLVRWDWPGDCPPVDAFDLYRIDSHGERISLGRVAPITEPAEADAVLGPEWDWAEAEERMGISDLAELLALRYRNEMQAVFLAMTNYRVALVYGWGYYDTEPTPGEIYTYQAVAVRFADGDRQMLDPVVAVAGGYTPLLGPIHLSVTEVIDESLAGHPDWALAQQNRIGDRSIFLIWSPETQSQVPDDVTPPGAIGYDIYRSTDQMDGFVRINEEPVVPMPATDPDDPTDISPLGCDMGCEEAPATAPDCQACPDTDPEPLKKNGAGHEYFFKDDDPNLQYGVAYHYRVAPRDLLGRPLDWANEDHRPHFCKPVAAVPRDMMPPAVPRNLTATPHHLEHTIVLTWTAQMEDTAGYILYWSWSPDSDIVNPDPTDPEQHWMELAHIASPLVDQYEHTGGLVQNEPYWYRIRAFDDAGNLSAPSQPVPATLRDRVPPSTPQVWTQEAEADAWFVIEHLDDTVEILVYCSVDGGPTRLWRVIDADGNVTHMNPDDEFSPKARSRAECTFQAVDASGNRSLFSDPQQIYWGPEASPPPPAPVITTIITSDKHQDLAALIEWTAETTPGVTGFRVYRQAYGEQEPARIADESTLETTTRYWADPAVEASVVYTYTVAVYRPESRQHGDEVEVESDPYLYKAVEALDCCTRPLGTVTWDDASHYAEAGTHLMWVGSPAGEFARFVVYRSWHEQGPYAQLTPPLTQSSYVDTDAWDKHFWYVVLQLDWNTGEVISRSDPWSASADKLSTGAGNGTAPGLDAGSDAPDQDRLIADLWTDVEWLMVSEAEPAEQPASDPPLPRHLRLGNQFTIHVDVDTYDDKSTWECLTGEGTMPLGDKEWGEHYPTVPFTCISAEPYPDHPNWGLVTEGAVSVPIPSPIRVDYPDGFTYHVMALEVDEKGGEGLFRLVLPTDIVVHDKGNISHPFQAWFMAYPDLTFSGKLDINGTCNVETPDFYFQTNPLPLRAVPTGSVQFTHEMVVLNGACTQYDERFTGQRPQGKDADAGDGYLRAIYNSTGKVFIEPGGMHGRFSTNDGIEYATAVPYAVYLSTHGGAFDLKYSRIVGGTLGSGAVGLDYFQGVVPLRRTDLPAVTPTGAFSAQFDKLSIGLDGSVYGSITANDDLVWANGGFVLKEKVYDLYLPPIQMGLPWVDLLDNHPDDRSLQPGINFVTDAEPTTEFYWYICGGGEPIQFPAGVDMDIYLRHGGVSDIITANIPPGDDVTSEIYGYKTVIHEMKLAFCDNFIFDSDVAGDVDLPYPADVKVPLIGIRINPNTACVEGGLVSRDALPLTLAYWQTDLYAEAVQFRPTGAQQRTLWIRGALEIPHLELAGSPQGSGIPLDASFTPAGRFDEANVLSQETNYTFDGFHFLLEEVRLSAWHPQNPEQPAWDTDATLGDAPADPEGFVAVEGAWITPFFGILRDEQGHRPSLQFPAEGSFVGFTARPTVERGWTSVAGLGFRFDLLYVHATNEHAGRFMAWDQITLLDIRFIPLVHEFFGMDWSVLIEPEETGVYVGLSSMPALLWALVDMTESSMPDEFTEALRETAEEVWIPLLDQDEVLKGRDIDGYLDITEAIWAHVGSAEDVTRAVDRYISPPVGSEDDPVDINRPRGGETRGVLRGQGVDMRELRGQAAFIPVINRGDTLDWELEQFDLSVKMQVTWEPDLEDVTRTPKSHAQWVDYSAEDAAWAQAIILEDEDDDDEDERDPFIAAKRLTFRITRDGEYAVVGNGVETNLLENDLKVDFALLIAIEENPRLEGGLVIYDLEKSGVEFAYLGAVFGVGQFNDGPFFYLGALGDGRFGSDSGGGFIVGGSLLVGTIYSDSIVLRAMGFADLLDRLEETGAGELLIGGYVRVYGDFPIYESGCMARLTAGGEVAGYYFAAIDGNEAAWGGQLRGFVTGRLLCVVSARGDLTLAIFSPGNDDGTKPYAFQGDFWIAGGLGLCDPNNWRCWDDRWWGEGRLTCWVLCGAQISTDYNVRAADAWSFDFQGECR